MLLSYEQLLEMVDSGVLDIGEYDQVNGASIDLTLGNKILIERRPEPGFVVSLKDRTPLTMESRDIAGSYYVMAPGEAILAQTKEVFHLPLDVSGLYVLKSSMARIFLNHCNAGFADAGWNDSVLTLELMNQTRFHPIRLDEGVRIGQMLFFQHKAVPRGQSYASRGRYNSDRTVSAIKP